MLKRFFIAAMLISAGSFPSKAVAQSSDPAWLDSLRLQLTVDKNCEVQYFLNIRERENATGNTYSARVQCDDGRQFDATLTEPATDFKIETCGQAVCGINPQSEDKS